MTNPLYDTLIGARAQSTAPLLYLADGTTLSYADMATRVARLSGYLRTMGLEKGDRLAMQCPKSPQALALYLACLHSGVIFLPLVLMILFRRKYPDWWYVFNLEIVRFSNRTGQGHPA